MLNQIWLLYYYTVMICDLFVLQGWLKEILIVQKSTLCCQIIALLKKSNNLCNSALRFPHFKFFHFLHQKFEAHFIPPKFLKKNNQHPKQDYLDGTFFYKVHIILLYNQTGR